MSFRKNAIIIFLLSFSLSGCLPALFTGAACSTMEFAKDRPARETMSDNRISLAIKASFMKNDFHSLYTQIKVDVVQGRVLLTGTIDKEEDALNAVKICWNQTGVAKVINELKVDKNSRKFNLVQYTRDSMITSQIKAKTLFYRNIKFVNYTVITINDVVYLFGIARSEEELKAVGDIAANTKRVTKVVSHVQIREPKESLASSDVIESEEIRDASIINDEDLVVDDNDVPQFSEKTPSTSGDDFVVDTKNNSHSDW